MKFNEKPLIIKKIFFVPLFLHNLFCLLLCMLNKEYIHSAVLCTAFFFCGRVRGTIA